MVAGGGKGGTNNNEQRRVSIRPGSCPCNPLHVWLCSSSTPSMSSFQDSPNRQLGYGTGAEVARGTCHLSPRGKKCASSRVRHVHPEAPGWFREMPVNNVIPFFRNYHGDEEIESNDERRREGGRGGGEQFKPVLFNDNYDEPWKLRKVASP